MKVSFLIIGSEVLDGKISDLNTKILADFLRPYSIEIHEAVMTRDDKSSILDAMNKLFQASDVVITSGGLGPTKDDITKETLGAFFGKKLIYSEESFTTAIENYRRFGRTFPGKHHGYSYLPETFIPLSNSTGFAPGFYKLHEEKILFSAPGVPREFKSMLEDHFLKLIDHRLEKESFLDRFIVRTKKIPEEKIFGEVDPDLWDKLASIGEVSSLPHLMGVDIGIKIRGKTQVEIASKVSQLKKIFEESPIRKNIWHYGPESIEEKIVQLAKERKIKFGFAESATGGLCSHRITNISGSSQCFMGSVICYDERIKENILGVKRETLEKETAVSLECARQMALGLKEKFCLDIAISITGFAGPGGGNENFPVGSVCIGKASKLDASAESFHLLGDREILKQRFSQAALYALLEEVENFSHD